jgi:hypothetical protein
VKMGCQNVQLFLGGPLVPPLEATAPESVRRDIYATLRIPVEVMKPVKTWHRRDAEVELVTKKILTPCKQRIFFKRRRKSG